MHILINHLHGNIQVYGPAQTLTESPKEEITSILFTRKARQEDKISDIIQALQHCYAGRNDKARAVTEEVRQWQKEGYIDPNYNARVMYDELNKIIPLPFQYDGFRKYYNE